LYQAGEWKVFVDAAGKVHVGAQAGEAWVARADKTDQAIADLAADLSALKTWVAAHTHPVATTGSAAAQTGTAAQTAAPGPTLRSPASVAASTTKTT
jgi:hypothetical protein